MTDLTVETARTIRKAVEAPFIPQPTLMREIPGVAKIYAIGDGVRIDDQANNGLVLAATIDANPQHYLTETLTNARKRVPDVVALVLGDIQGKPAQITLTPAQYALGASERERKAAYWSARNAAMAPVHAAEAEWGRVHNEGGDGYNPYA